MNRQAKATPVAPPNSLTADGDDDRGQPVRLASGERALSDQPAELNLMPRPASNTSSPMPGSIDSDGPMNMPETPQIPLVSRLPDLTVVNATPLEPVSSSPTLVSPDAAPTATDHVAEVKVPAVEQRTASSFQPTEPNAATTGHVEDTTAEPGSLVPQTLETSPTAVAKFESPTNPQVPEQAPGLPISDGNSAAPGAATTAPHVSSHPVTGAANRQSRHARGRKCHN